MSARLGDRRISWGDQGDHHWALMEECGSLAQTAAANPTPPFPQPSFRQIDGSFRNAIFAQTPDITRERTRIICGRSHPADLASHRLVGVGGGSRSPAVTKRLQVGGRTDWPPKRESERPVPVLPELLNLKIWFFTSILFVGVQSFHRRPVPCVSAS